MADNTKIEWSNATWNPVTGCSVVSAGCKHCYAMKLAGTRMKNHPSRAGLTIDTAAGPVWNGQVRFNEQWLDQPLRWSRPRRIFVCAHGDLFHESVPDTWIDRVFAVMALSPQHTFQVLTKRAERMHAYLSEPDVGVRIGREESAFAKLAAFYKPKKGTANIHIGCRRYMPLSNVHLGVSVENQAAADGRIPLLLATSAAVRWISAEPLLGHIDIVLACWQASADIVMRFDRTPLEEIAEVPKFLGINWVVCGGESGVNARPMHPDWARSLRDQCSGAGVPFLFKQWGEFGPCELYPPSDPAPYSCVTFSGTHLQGEHAISGGGGPGDNSVEIIARFGKKKAGRLLDGVLHDEYPTP